MAEPRRAAGRIVADHLHAQRPRFHQPAERHPGAARAWAEGPDQLGALGLRLHFVEIALLGVGPGMFPLADDSYMKEIGYRKGGWAGTHNSYTQVSSELGIPALLFFLAAVAMSLKSTYSVFKKTRGDPRLEEMGSFALGLHYCLIIYAVTIFFDHIAYTVMLPVFGGLAASLARAAESRPS